MAEKHVSGLVEFFRSPYWTDFVTHYLDNPEDPEDEVYHAHIYCDSSIHPDSLHVLMKNYFEAIGHPLTRRIDSISPHGNQVGLHSVYPLGLAHFDMYNRWNPNVIMAPMPEDSSDAENGHNRLSWGKRYQDWFVEHNECHFKTVGPKQEQRIRDFFMETQWKEFRSHILNPIYTHCHMNVEINFDPKVLELIAREELAKIGWTVERVVPCVYDVYGEYRGKIVFLCGHPEEVFDIAWLYNPDVTIRRAQEKWVLDMVGFDCWSNGGYEEKLALGDYYTLSEEEVKSVTASFYET